MASEYEQYISDAWRWSADVGVSITDHALARWDERLPADVVSPEHAWENGAVVHESFYGVFETNTGEWPDEVRVFHEDHGIKNPYQVAMVARDGVIKTIFNARQLTGPERAYLNALKPRITGGQNRSDEL